MAKPGTHPQQRMNLLFVPMHNPENRAHLRPRKLHLERLQMGTNAIAAVTFPPALIHNTSKKFP